MMLLPVTALLIACLQLVGTGQLAAPDTRAAVSGTGVIRGRVIDATRGVPIPRATVMASLWQTVPNGASGFTRAKGFTARTGPDGSYVIAELPSGQFILSAERPGFFQAQTARATVSKPVMLADGGDVVVPDLLLSRGGVIQGRVLDDAGEPVIGAWVSPVGRLGSSGAEPLREVGLAAPSDDRGRFRLYGLRPGRYTVRARPRMAQQQGPPVGPLQGDARELLPAFAGGLGSEQAQFVDVEAAAETTLDVRLERGLLSTVAGRVMADDDRPLDDVSVSLRTADPAAVLHVSGNRVLPDGRFQLPLVPPGRYRLVAEESRPQPRRGPAPLGRVGWTTVEVVGDGAAVDVALPLGSGSTAPGRIESDDGDLAALMRAPLRVEARPPSYGSLPTHTSGADVGADGTFTLRGVFGPRVLQVPVLPHGWWVKSVTIGGRDASGGHDFAIRGTADPIEIVVSRRPSGVRGTVAGADGGIAAGTIVRLMPAGSDRPATPDVEGIRGAGVRPDGSFIIEAIKPGRYLLVAYGPDSLLTHRSIDELHAIADAQGTLVDVVEGQIATVSLRLVDR